MVNYSHIYKKHLPLLSFLYPLHFVGPMTKRVSSDTKLISPGKYYAKILMKISDVTWNKSS